MVRDGWRRKPFSGGAQVTAETMPYHMHWRPECNTGRSHLLDASSTRDGIAGDRSRPRVGPTPVEGRRSPSCEVRTFGVEYLVRAARVTDIDRLVALGGGDLTDDGDAHPLDAADLLRQLVYLPQASIFVAESQRVVVGGAVLALRPSVRAGGFVGTIDLLVVDPGHDAERVTDALLEEVIRSARNKGCTQVEATRPDDPAALGRWAALGFIPADPRIQRPVAAVGTTSRRI
jgi:GNAT superfamily N-acetyltransferase